jgi:hypothetical protein
MSDELDDADLDTDDLAQEGVRAFNRMTAAMHGLEGRIITVDASLGTKVSAAERAATLAASAAQTAKQAADGLHAAARAKARSHASWAVLGALAGVLGAGGAGYWLGHASGREGGLADGYQAAHDEKAAASWANTPTGRLAFALDQAGSLTVLATCANHGWQTETRQGRRICFVKPDASGSIYGWTLP